MAEQTPVAWQRLIADVQRSTGRELRLRLVEQEPRLYIVTIEMDGRPHGGRDIWPLGDQEAVLADLADRVQEHTLDEEIWGGWPFCPQHAAHLDPVVHDGVAVWLCPRGEVVSRIGDLPGRH